MYVNTIIKKQLEINMKLDKKTVEKEFMCSKYQIADITFGKEDVKEADMLAELMEIKEEIKLENLRMKFEKSKQDIQNHLKNLK